ncbi:MAG: WD40 repeat domain-containing serine/threonine-protein kinase [Planctomycetota bacterium]
MTNGHKRFNDEFLDETLNHQECQQLDNCIEGLQNGRLVQQMDNSLFGLANELWQVGDLAADQASSDAGLSDRGVGKPDIEGYEIHELIGRGGMGLVYRATDTQLRRRVAIKVLPANVVGSERARKRFRVEVQAAAQLEHTGIVPVYAFGEYKDGLFYTMREIVGVDLARKLRSRSEGSSAFPGPEVDFNSAEYRRWVAGVGKQLAEALAHSHDHLIVHRDIKPANILLDSDSNVMLSDFGLARINEGSDLTGADDVMGTVLYMSPEQTEGSESVDARTDLYSLGVTLYELLTGRTAITESGVVAAIKQINEGRITKLRQLRPSVERDLETIILKSISPEPSARYQTAREMADDLDRFLSVLPIKARRATLGMRVARWARRNSQWVTTLGVVGSLLLAVIFGIAIYSANKSASDAEKIRDQSARLLDRRGAELLVKGKALQAADAFRQAAELTRDAHWAERELQRVSAIEAWSPKLVEKSVLDGRLLALLEKDQKLISREGAGGEKCILLAGSNSSSKEKVLFETSRKIEFARRNKSGTIFAIEICDRSNNDPEIKLYDLTREHLETIVVGFSKRLTNMWFSPEDRYLIMTGWDGEIVVWDLEKGERAASAEFPLAENRTSWVYSASTDRDRSVLVAATNPGRLFAYSLPDLEPIWIEPKQLGWWTVDALAVSGNGQWAAAGAVTGEIRLWHISSGIEVRLDNTIAGEPTVASFSEDGRTLVVGDDRGGVYLWEIPDSSAAPEKGMAIARKGFVMWHEYAIVSLDFGVEDQLLVGAGNSARVWRLTDFQPTTPNIPIEQTLYSARWVDDGSVRMRSRTGDANTTWIWHLPSFFDVTTADNGSVRQLLRKSNGKIEAVVALATPSANFVRRSLPQINASPAATALNLPSEVSQISFGTNASESRIAYIVSDGDEHRLHVVDRETLEYVREPVLLDIYLRDARLNAEGTKWIANNFNDTVAMGDVASGEIESTLQLPNWVVDSRFVGRGEFAAISWDYRLRIWNKQGSEVAQFEQHARPELMVAFEQFILVATSDRIYIYERAKDGTWEPRGDALPTSERLLALALSPARNRVLSCGEKGTNLLWSMEGKVVSQFNSGAPVSDCRFSPDGQWFATLTEGGSVQLRSASTGELMSPTISGRTPITKFEWIDESLFIAGEAIQNGFWISELEIPENWLK